MVITLICFKDDVEIVVITDEKIYLKNSFNLAIQLRTISCNQNRM